MKHIKTLIFGFAALLFAVSCEDTNENLVGARDVAVVPGISDIGPGFFTGDFENSYVAFNVSLPEGKKVDNAYIEFVFGSKSAKVTDISSFPANIEIAATDVFSKLGISGNDLAVGSSSFTMYVVTTLNGVTTRSTAALVVPVTCVFDPSGTTGTFNAVSSWWGADGPVTITADPDDPYTLYIAGMAELDGATGNGNKVKITINPDTFQITGGKVTVADNAFGYTGLSYAVVGGTFSSCDGTLNITFAVTVDQGSFGSGAFTFTRIE